MINQTVVIGRSHRIMQQNCQDFSAAREFQNGFAFGVVLDGCGSKYRGFGRPIPSSNEVGSKLLGHFANAYLTEALAELGAADDVEREDLQELIDGLHIGSLSFLENLLMPIPFAAEQERAEFTATNLLCTMLGFIVTPDEAAFFWAGDGFLCRDSHVTRLDSGNQPDYIAYQLSNSDIGGATGSFQVEFIDTWSQCNWLAVATDGWSESLVGELETPRENLSLQRWVNCEARKRGQFEDDGAAAIWWRS